MAETAIYRRGQVEWAIWRYMTFNRPDAGPPHPTFQARTKRLLELDRSGHEGRPSFAFGDQVSPGKGTDRVFGAFDGFCLTLAVELLDAGFKQGEVVYLLQHIRDELRHQYREIMRWPNHERQRVAARHHPDFPSYDQDGFRDVDFRVFVVLRKLELSELFPKPEVPTLPNEPLFLRSLFCRGIEKLALELNRMKQSYRKGMVLEIGKPARLVTGLLERAPEIKRGRC